MVVAYLVNQYPKVSHSFIRREIVALEEAGVEVARFSVRAADQLVDAADRAEAARTTVLLAKGGLALLTATIKTALTRPLRSWRGLRQTVRMGRRSHRGVLRHLVYLAEAALLLGELRRAGVDHLHAHFGTNATAVALLCRLLGGPRYSFTVHGPEEFDMPVALSLGDKICHAHAVVAISNFARSQLSRWCPYAHWSKIVVVHCAVDESYLAAPPPPPEDSRRLVCVGRLCEQKGQALLLQAAAELARDGVELEVVLVGDGEMRSDLEALITRLGLPEVVTITGWASGEEVRAHLCGARALVLPSFGEGLPVVIMEALALGRPAISTAIAGIPELVRDGENGWLIHAGDVNALTEAMRAALAADRATLARMGAAGRKAVEASHSATKEAGKLAALFTNGARI